mmetsp:Transcript_31673/g.42204  ORF Transcript_31673/g.42204 Transcript_31673/m.42204 type:complete len:90 (+) Transcript_31673:216-485(+)
MIESKNILFPLRVKIRFWYSILLQITQDSSFYTFAWHFRFVAVYFSFFLSLSVIFRDWELRCKVAISTDKGKTNFTFETLVSSSFKNTI